jgi:F-type H+-transporting ATPase subunit delta
VNEFSIARRYAKAIFELGVEEGRFEQIGSELAAAAQAIESDKELLAALSEPTSAREAKMKVAETLGASIGAGTTVSNALRLLAERSRLALLPQIADAYGRLADERAGRVKARVVSAVPLNDETAAQIGAELSKATQRNVIVERAVDPSILGGIVADVGGQTFDASLRTQLEALRKQLKA